MQPYLANPDKTKELLARHGFLIKKGYGQNFLIDEAVTEGIVRAAGLEKTDCVMEIGPGIGTMTQYLARAAGKVLAVEIDKKLEPVLADSLVGFPEVSIVWGDILKQDLDALLQAAGIKPPVPVVANLPYYITTPVLMRLLQRPDLFSCLTVMVQSEVGERMAAAPGSKEYGYLSLSVQYYAQPELVLRVSPHAFLPQPKVSSVVVRLIPSPQSRPACRRPEYMFHLAKAAFLQRRKTLANALSGYGPAGVSRQQVADALSTMGLDPQIRGEKLHLEEFAALADLLDKPSDQKEISL